MMPSANGKSRGQIGDKSVVVPGNVPIFPKSVRFPRIGKFSQKRFYQVKIVYLINSYYVTRERSLAGLSPLSPLSPFCPATANRKG